MWMSLTVFMLLAWLLTSSICIFRSIIGLPCPGCGLTRAFLAVMRGDPAAAFSAHPLFLLAAVSLAAAAIIMFIKPVLLSSRPASVVIVVIFVVFFAVYIYRMIIYFPTSEPLTFNQNAFIPRILNWLRSLIVWLGAA